MLKKIYSIVVLSFCGSFLLQAQSPFDLSIPNETAEIGSTTCIPIVAQTFENVLGCQFSVVWDPLVLQFVNVQNLAFQDQTDFNSSAPGELRHAWSSSTFEPDFLPSGTVLFEICFDVIGDIGSTSSISFSDTPLNIEVVGLLDPNDVQSQIILIDDLLFENGSLTVIENDGEVLPEEEDPEVPEEVNDITGLDLQIPDITAEIGSNTCIPVIVQQFDDILSYQFGISWDTTILQFTNLQYNVTEIDAIDFNSNITGELRHAWASMSGEGISFPTETVLFEICFDLIGSIGTSSQIIFDPTIMLIEIVDNNEYLVDAVLQNGNITTVNGEEEELENPSTGTDELILKNNTSLFPNPTSGLLKIITPDILIDQLDLYTLSGQSILTIPNVNKSEYLLNIDGNQDGVYFLKIKTKQGVITKRIIKF